MKLKFNTREKKISINHEAHEKHENGILNLFFTFRVFSVFRGEKRTFHEA